MTRQRESLATGSTRALVLLAAVLLAACDEDARRSAGDAAGPAGDAQLHEVGPTQDATRQDGPATDGNADEAGTGDDAALDGPVADSVAADGPTADGPTADGTTADGATADGTSTGDAATDGTASQVLTIDSVAYDMFGPPHRTDGAYKSGVQIGAAPWGAHEALPAGANPSWDWYHGTRFGETPPWDNYVIPWGQVFYSASNTVWNVRLQVRRVNLYVLGSDHVWRKVKASVSPDVEPDGFFASPGTFSKTPGSSLADADIRAEGPDQGWSIRLSSLQQADRGLFHWFYSAGFYPRPAVPAGTKGVFVAAQLRLIPDTVASVNLAAAQLIASMGADHWPAATGPKPAGKQITPFMQARMKRVGASWTWFTGHAFTG